MASLISALENNAAWELSPYCGIPVSTDTAQKTFCALGDDQWMQVYDGKYHCFGKMVFDKGLHGKEAEFGFLGSTLKALDFGKDNIGAKSIGDLYCDVHRIACSHFQGKENNTEMHASEAGRFRNDQHSKVSCKCWVSQILGFVDRADLKGEDRRAVIEQFELLRSARGDEFIKNCADPSFYQRMGLYYQIELLNSSSGEELEKLFQKKIKETTDYLLHLKNDLQSGKAYPKLILYSGCVVINYASPDGSNFTFEDVVQRAFSEFDRSIAAIDAELLQIDLSDKCKVEHLTNQKLVLIADLYQKLEWFHPFPDGQGRTDLITLGMLLSKHGFCPAILDEPYVSSFAPLADWVSYLKEGMIKWQQAAKASAIFNQSV